MIRKPDTKLIPILATLLLAAALVTTVGCGSDDDDDCVGAGCLSPAGDVDAGEFGGVTCTQLCNHVYEVCDSALKVGIDTGPSSEVDCVMMCEKGLFTLDESLCLAGPSCGTIPECLDQ